MQDGLEALDEAYRDLVTVVQTLDERSAWRSTGCVGWSVRDLVWHLLCDARRGLVALATPALPPADRDSVSYWRDFPAGADSESRGIRATRIAASNYRLDGLIHDYAETATAVRVAATRVDADDLVGTQGFVLRVDDLLTTLAVEATIHHLDLTTDLARPGPSSDSLATVRRTLDGLLGHPSPPSWDAARWARLGTGRTILSEQERAALGAAADRLPLLG